MYQDNVGLGMPCDFRQVQVVDNSNGVVIFPNLGRGQQPLTIQLTQSSTLDIALLAGGDPSGKEQPDPSVQCVDPATGKTLNEYDCITHYAEIGDPCGDGCCPEVDFVDSKQCTDQGLVDADSDPAIGGVGPCLNSTQDVKRDPNACCWATASC
jgi:hypothetical protein